MIEGTIDAEPTFQPWYHHVLLVLPEDARTPEARALKAFGRKCRAGRIQNNIALAPSVPMFDWQERAA